MHRLFSFRNIRRRSSDAAAEVDETFGEESTGELQIANQTFVSAVRCSPIPSRVSSTISSDNEDQVLPSDDSLSSLEMNPVLQASVLAEYAIERQLRAVLAAEDSSSAFSNIEELHPALQASALLEHAHYRVREQQQQEQPQHQTLQHETSRATRGPRQEQTEDMTMQPPSHQHRVLEAVEANCFGCRKVPKSPAQVEEDVWNAIELHPQLQQTMLDAYWQARERSIVENSHSQQVDRHQVAAFLLEQGTALNNIKENHPMPLPSALSHDSSPGFSSSPPTPDTRPQILKEIPVTDHLQPTAAVGRFVNSEHAVRNHSDSPQRQRIPSRVRSHPSSLQRKVSDVTMAWELQPRFQDNWEEASHMDSVATSNRPNNSPDSLSALWQELLQQANLRSKQLAASSSHSSSTSRRPGPEEEDDLHSSSHQPRRLGAQLKTSTSNSEHTMGLRTTFNCLSCQKHFSTKEGSWACDNLQEPHLYCHNCTMHRVHVQDSEPNGNIFRLGCLNPQCQGTVQVPVPAQQTNPRIATLAPGDAKPNFVDSPCGDDPLQSIKRQMHRTIKKALRSRNGKTLRVCQRCRTRAFYATDDAHCAVCQVPLPAQSTEERKQMWLDLATEAWQDQFDGACHVSESTLSASLSDLLSTVPDQAANLAC